MTQRVRLSLVLVIAQAGWMSALLLVEALVAWAFAAAEGRPLDVRRVLSVGFPPAACLGMCVTLSRARGARLDVALSALGWSPLAVTRPCVALAWLVCAVFLSDAASPLARRDRAAWRIEDTADGRRVHTPQGVVDLIVTSDGVHRSDLNGEAARSSARALAPPAPPPDPPASIPLRWLAPGPPVAAAAWALLATPTPLSWPLTLGLGGVAYLGAVALSTR